MKKWIPSCYMMIAAFFYSLQYLDVKTISSYYGIWMIAFSRGITSLFLCVVSLFIQKNTLASNNLQIFINGVSGYSASNTGTSTLVNPLYVGIDGTGSNYNFNGYIDDLRITRGYARYTSNFTPPGAALSDQ
jgi:hypothetical protein